MAELPPILGLAEFRDLENAIDQLCSVLNIQIPVTALPLPPFCSKLPLRIRFRSSAVAELTKHASRIAATIACLCELKPLIVSTNARRLTKPLSTALKGWLATDRAPRDEPRGPDAKRKWSA